MKSKPVIKKKSAPKKKEVLKKKPVKAAANNIISKSKGAEMVNRFREKKENLNSVTFSRAIQFPKSLFENLLKLKGVQDIRIYNAINEKNEHTFVVTAVDNKYNDIYFKNKRETVNSKTSVQRSAAPDNDGVGNMGNSCPAYTGDIIIL